MKKAIMKKAFKKAKKLNKTIDDLLIKTMKSKKGKAIAFGEVTKGLSEIIEQGHDLGSFFIKHYKE